MPVRRGHVAPQNTFIDTIIRKFEGQSKLRSKKRAPLCRKSWLKSWLKSAENEHGYFSVTGSTVQKVDRAQADFFGNWPRLISINFQSRFSAQWNTLLTSSCVTVCSSSPFKFFFSYALYLAEYFYRSTHVDSICGHSRSLRACVTRLPRDWSLEPPIGQTASLLAPNNWIWSRTI